MFSEYIDLNPEGPPVLARREEPNKIELPANKKLVWQEFERGYDPGATNRQRFRQSTRNHTAYVGRLGQKERRGLT